MCTTYLVYFIATLCPGVVNPRILICQMYPRDDQEVAREGWNERDLRSNSLPVGDTQVSPQASTQNWGIGAIINVAFTITGLHVLAPTLQHPYFAAISPIF